MKKINIADPYFNIEDKKFIHNELDKILDGKLSMGPNVTEFENEFAKKINIKHAIATSSCTAALETVLYAIGVENKEVILPSQTFIGSGMSVYNSKAKLVFAEISKNTFCLDIEDVKKKITSNTKAIMLVHMAGYITSDIEDFVKLCNENDISLIEDAAHAPGACIDNNYAGSFGIAGCFSFYPTKVITSGEGGMVTTNDDKIARIARSLQNRGRDMSNKKDELYNLPGRNIRMPELSALLGRVQLNNLDSYLKNRQNVAKIYKKKLDNINGIKVILPKKIESSSCWKIIVLLDERHNREEIVSKLNHFGIQVDTAYTPPLHLQPIISETCGTFNGDLPITEDLMRRHICLPSHQSVSEEDANYVVEKILEVTS
tara:strand:+ start:290 stop:1411 length:1122 start_codon:yes stop_codon:yes gene_type:complete